MKCSVCGEDRMTLLGSDGIIDVHWKVGQPSCEGSLKFGVPDVLEILKDKDFMEGGKRGINAWREGDYRPLADIEAPESN